MGRAFGLSGDHADEASAQWNARSLPVGWVGRLVAVDDAGISHEPSASMPCSGSRWGQACGWVTGGIQWAAGLPHQGTPVPGPPLGRWVEIRNIALQPGLRTQVSVVDAEDTNTVGTAVPIARVASLGIVLSNLQVQASHAMPFLEETNRSLQKQIAKVQDELLDAQRQLIERRALGTLGGQDSGAESDSLQRPEPVPTSYENLVTVPFEWGQSLSERAT